MRAAVPIIKTVEPTFVIDLRAGGLARVHARTDAKTAKGAASALEPTAMIKPSPAKSPRVTLGVFLSSDKKPKKAVKKVRSPRYDQADGLVLPIKNIVRGTEVIMSAKSGALLWGRGSAASKSAIIKTVNPPLKMRIDNVVKGMSELANQLIAQ
jgi:hypothetical protein